MTFPEAEAISTAFALPVRRIARSANDWFTFWRALWFFWDTTLTPPAWRIVKATDYSPVDLLANDWTTVPAPLTSCPITPTEPAGGGPPIGLIPTSGPGAPLDFPPPAGSGGGGSSGAGGETMLPTPDSGTDLKVTFADLDGAISAPYYGVTFTDLNVEWTLGAAGAGIWTVTRPIGYFSTTGPSGRDHGFLWTVRAERVPGSIPTAFHVFMTVAPDIPGGGVPTGGFGDVSPEPQGTPINNTYNVVSAPSYSVRDGTATVSM